MPTYFRPSVYFEESLRALSDTPNDPAESAAAFVGKANGGPDGPTLVTSWHTYQALFGPISYEINDLSYAVYSFFANGGSGCYVVRAIPSDATPATLDLHDGAGVLATDRVLTLTAIASGTWASSPTSASRVFVTVRNNSTDRSRFELSIDVGNSTFISGSETFVDLSMDPADPRYAQDVVNSPTIGSKYVRLAHDLVNNLTNKAPGQDDATPETNEIFKVPMTGGSEGVAAVNLVTATTRLDQVDRNLVVNVPGATAADAAAIATWAATSGRHFIVADVPKPAANETAAASKTAMIAYADALGNTSHIAAYGPWSYMTDPGSSAGGTRLTAPGGAVVAHYLRTDAVRGVHKAPAGIATALVGVVAPYAIYSHTEQDDLAKASLNLIKAVPGSGVVIWGARTQSVNLIDRYVPIRRLLIAIKAALNEVTRFAVFENIDADLRESVENIVERFLQTQFDAGALKGDNYSQAFFVRCNDTNNPPAVEEAGQIIIDVGVALKTPAEFIIIRIGQQQSGTVTSDSLEAN